MLLLGRQSMIALFKRWPQIWILPPPSSFQICRPILSAYLERLSWLVWGVLCFLRAMQIESLLRLFDQDKGLGRKLLWLWSVCLVQCCNVLIWSYTSRQEFLFISLPTPPWVFIFVLHLRRPHGGDMMWYNHPIEPRKWYNDPSPRVRRQCLVCQCIYDHTVSMPTQKNAPCYFCQLGYPPTEQYRCNSITSF